MQSDIKSLSLRPQTARNCHAGRFFARNPLSAGARAGCRACGRVAPMRRSSAMRGRRPERDGSRRWRSVVDAVRPIEGCRVEAFGEAARLAAFFARPDSSCVRAMQCGRDVRVRPQVAAAAPGQRDEPHVGGCGVLAGCSRAFCMKRRDQGFVFPRLPVQ